MWFVLGLLSLATWLFYRYYVSMYKTYWQKRGVPSYPSKFPFGSNSNFLTLKKYQGYVFQKMYHEFASYPLFGIFSLRAPILVLRDPELIRLILTKEFSHFRDRMVLKLNENDVLTHHLFNLDGERWRALRVKLTPTFTSGKLKAMFPLFISCAEAFNSLLMSKIDSEVDIKELTGRLTADIICSCAFGLDTNTINNPDNKLRKIMTDAIKISPWVVLKVTLFNVIPKLSFILNGRICFISLFIETEKYLINLVEKTVEYREKHGIKRNDFLELLMQLKNKGAVGDDMKDEIKDGTCQPFELSLGLMTAQCFVFFIAGFETSSSVQSFCLYELAVNQEIQTRVRKEIDSFIEKHEGLTYQAIQEMEYLDMVVSETMRKYPTVPTLLRRCTKTFTTPMGYKIKQGDAIVIPVYAIHHDANYFTNPEKFDPERFSRENNESINPFTYLPFGEGPRMCIGMRFAQVQTKVGLITILRKFRVEPCTATSIPLELSGSSPFTVTKDPILLKLVAHSGA